MITVDALTAGYGKLEILQDLSLSFAAGNSAPCWVPTVPAKAP